MALAWTGVELASGQTQNGVNVDFEVKFDLEGHDQSPPKTIGILTKVFYTYGPNLVTLAWMGHGLSRGQASAYRTHGRTHRQTGAGNDNTRRPKLASGKKWHHKGKRFTSLIICRTLPCQIDIEVWVNEYRPWDESSLANIVDQPYHKLVHTLQKRIFFREKILFCIWRLIENIDLTPFEQINSLLPCWAHNPSIMTFADAGKR